MPSYRFFGSDSVLYDEEGYIHLNKRGQTVELDAARAARFIADGAPLAPVEDNTDSGTPEEGRI